jgi:galactofuranosylgalactofuranosylrhamnosyl-N-acetylglucosaminyl-diphospho-decaprenol beta-1,5/1,6-galactofuranosyltransferase
LSLPSVSVVIPVFNRDDLVAASIHSVQTQAGVAVEIIVVDDGSTDATPDVITDVARADARVRLVRTAHAGPAAARNAGVAAARGEYLTFVDSDDLCPAGRIRRQIDKLAGRSDVTAVVGAVLFFEELDATGAPRRDPRHVPFHNATLQSATLRTDDFRGFGPLDQTLGFAEDVDFFLRLLEADSRLILESEIACFYRHHPGNMTRDLRGKQQGYVRAYARSLARRRASGRTGPVKRFFPRQFDRDTEFGGGHVLQTFRPTAEQPGLVPFINAFYLRYWRELTGLETLSVRIVASGHGSIRVRHRRPDGAQTVIREVALNDERTTLSLEIELGDPAQDGVVHLDVDDGVVVHAGSWVTFDEPRQDVQLAIVICSLNQPEAVTESLHRLAGAQAPVIVVHQGDAELRVPDGVKLVRQPNFGGSGGFARGMLEALDGGATHVLLLDDDVRLDPDVPARLRSLLAHLKRPTTIGGQMLDLSRPTVLGASHETVDLKRLRLRNPLGGVDLARPDATAIFTRRHVSDYNGWWCCCVPAETVRSVLPLPMFVRFDDVEHGLRTTRSGSEVVTMPGIFVWHKPFDSKIKLWYTYYDRRNKLIVAALHGALPGRTLARLFLSDCWSALALHRYDICWAACRGARDFLAGPSVVFSDPHERHQEIVAGVARYALRTIQSDRARGGRHVSLFTSLRLPEVARPARAIGREMLSCWWGLLRRGGRVSAEYRSTRAHYSSPAFWRAYLGMGT